MIAKKTSKKAPEEKKFLYFQSWVRICEDPFLHKASKHTDLSGCSNSVQPLPRSLLPYPQAAHDNSPAAALFDL